MAWRVGARAWPERRRAKWGNRKTVVGDLAFDSRWEAEHWTALRLREAAGEIRQLKRQVHLPIVIGQVKVATVIADFQYEEWRPGPDGQGQWVSVVADCKSEATRREPYYRLKKRLLEVVCGVTIVEVIKPGRQGARWTTSSRSRGRTGASR